MLTPLLKLGSIMLNMYIYLFFCFFHRSWGFLCPVHTPDGEPCGLLNHMTSTCSKYIFGPFSFWDVFNFLLKFGN